MSGHNQSDGKQFQVGDKVSKVSRKNTTQDYKQNLTNVVGVCLALGTDFITMEKDSLVDRFGRVILSLYSDVRVQLVDGLGVLLEHLTVPSGNTMKQRQSIAVMCYQRLYKLNCPIQTFNGEL